MPVINIITLYLYYIGPKKMKEENVLGESSPGQAVVDVVDDWAGAAGDVGVRVVGGQLAEVGRLAHLLHLRPML
jgi:hypothetical protein